MPETPAAQPIDPARIVGYLRETASCAVFDARIDACNVAADLLETLADPRFSGLDYYWCEAEERYVLKAIAAGRAIATGTDTLSALLALREAIRADGPATAETDTDA